MTLMQRLCWLTILSTAMAAPAFAGVRMAVHAEYTYKATQADTKVHPDTRSDLLVELADNYIAVKDGAKTTVYDLAHRRMLVLDNSDHTVDDHSLYVLIGFRELELRNRDGIAKAMGVANIQMPDGPPVFDEHALSLARPQGAQVVESKNGDGSDFTSGGATLLHSAAGGTAVGGADAARFVQFLRYTYGGHPTILRALQQAGRIPTRLSYRLQFPGSLATLELRISDVQPASLPSAFAATGYTPRRGAAADPLDRLVDRAWIEQPPPPFGQRAKAVEAINQALRDKRALEAFLGFTEMMLSGLAPPPAFSDAQKAQLQADPSIREVSVALAAKDAAGLRQAVATLQRLRPGAGTERHILALYEANDRLRLGDAAAARTLFAEVLQANPALAGAYKDVGDLYYMGFDTAHAWRCWDIARRLAPAFANVKAVDAFEATLAEKYPEYF